VRQAATQFESLFMQMVLKSMRDATPKSGLTGGSAEDMYTGMLDQQLAQSLSGRPGGLGEVIARQLSRNMPGGGQPEISAAGIDPSTAASGTGQARLATLIAKARATAGTTSPTTPSVEDTGAAGPDVSKLSPRQADFVRRIWPHAQAAEQQTGVPAAFVAGQAGAGVRAGARARSGCRMAATRTTCSASRPARAGRAPRWM
jgi:flagellar protein FlgJ